MLTTEMIIIRIILALVAGGIIGLEREYRDKTAGFRTLMLISLGSCLFTIISILLVSDTMDRIVANVVTGIGFIGGGVIFKSKEGVNGLITAATIWVTAAVGMAVGAGFYYAAGFTVLATFIILAFFYHIEMLIDRFNKEKIYIVKASLEPGIFSNYEDVRQKNNLKFIVGKRTRLAKPNNCNLYNTRRSKRPREIYRLYAKR
jgi:putative Mg2+ transporter-C (MgtC) family protein